jgi:hypothetical protein
MGLGLSIEVPAKSLGKRNWSTLAEDIATFAKADPADALLQQLMDVSRTPEGALEVLLHPAEEPLNFSLKENGALLCSAKTSTAGPGYHAYVVEWLEQLGRVCKLDWQWAPEGGGDETGYCRHRDMERLQAEMTRQLLGIVKIVVDHKADYKNLMLGMPVGFPCVLGNHCAISSMGFWDADWFDAFANGDEAQRLDLSRAFFPWWSEGRNAEFWERLGRVLLWVGVPWHVPESEAEILASKLPLECFERARKLSPGVRAPETELSELRCLLGDNAPQRPPHPEGIGFRRRMMLRPLVANWTIELPGYWYDEMQEDGKAQAYWFGDRTVRGSALSYNPKDDKPRTAADTLSILGVPPADAVHFKRGHIKGYASISRECDDGNDYFMLTGYAAAPDNICVVTICYDDPADKEWAFETWKTVNVPPPDE